MLAVSKQTFIYMTYTSENDLDVNINLQQCEKNVKILFEFIFLKNIFLIVKQITLKCFSVQNYCFVHLCLRILTRFVSQ